MRSNQGGTTRKSRPCEAETCFMKTSFFMENSEEKTKKSKAALREERVLKFWHENKTFEKSLKQTEGAGEFIFYEGPPTANGKPGIHHLITRAFKDAIPRYKTMRGY